MLFLIWRFDSIRVAIERKDVKEMVNFCCSQYCLKVNTSAQFQLACPRFHTRRALTWMGCVQVRIHGCTCVNVSRMHVYWESSSGKRTFS